MPFTILLQLWNIYNKELNKCNFNASFRKLLEKLKTELVFIHAYNAHGRHMYLTGIRIEEIFN